MESAIMPCCVCWTRLSLAKDVAFNVSSMAATKLVNLAKAACLNLARGFILTIYDMDMRLECVGKELTRKR